MKKLFAGNWKKSAGIAALSLIRADDLLTHVIPLVRIDIPYELARKADAFIGLAKLDEAHRVLTEAYSHATKFGSRYHLWSTLASLADVCSLLDQHEQADRHRKQAHLIVEEIAEGQREIGLRDSFLNQPRVQALMR